MTLLRRLAPLAVVFLAVSPRAVAGPPPVFVVSGGGYGHGVGMSQWGAYGQAKAGRSYGEILAYYYRGTTLGHTAGRAVRVLVRDGARTVTVGSAAPFVVTDANGERAEHAAGDLKLTAVSMPASAAVAITPTAGGELWVDGTAYHGSLRILISERVLRVVNVVPLELYLRSVVAGEVPSDWPAAALQAQAVAARTYALARTITNEPFDLYADTRSQVYGGSAKETPEATAAVTGTVLRILLYEGKPATTFFFASSGGRTAAGADIFALDLPYLVPVADPWDSLSPDHVWKPIRVTAARLRRSLKLPSAVTGVATESARSGHPTTIELTLRVGAPVEIPGAQFRAALGLRSTRFRVGQLTLSAPGPAVVFGTPMRLTGVAAGVTEPALEARPAGGVWQTVAHIRRAADGTFSAVVRPRDTTVYRLVGNGVIGPRLAVDVSPRIGLVARRGRGRMIGRVSPALPGSRVIVERLRNAIWQPVARPTVTADGVFVARVDVGAGSYRARVAAVAGLAAGVSPVVVVS